MKGEIRLAGFPAEGAFEGISEQEKMLVGVSGGVDSVVLLHLLHPLFGERLTVCHVNHGLRGSFSDEDECFVRDLAKKWDLPFLSQKGDVGKQAEERGISMELAAREFRYACFHQWAAETGSQVILLAHHANDQAETVLFNLCRGGGGIRGMSIASVRGGLRLVRPLLHCSKKDILAYAEKSSLEWREDHTNFEPVAVRNRLRMEVMPLLEDIMKRSVVEKISRTADWENERLEALEEVLAMMDLLDPQGRLFLPKVMLYSRSLCRVIIHWFLKQKGVSDISSELVENVEKMVFSESSSKINLPGNRFARRKEKRLIIE